MGKGTCTPIIPQPSCHAAHYHVVLTSPPKKKHPNGPKGDLQADISRRMDNGLRVQYKPRGIESWPSTRVRQLPSSNRVRDNWGRVHTRPGLEPLSRDAPDVLKARREVDGGIPSEGGIEPSDPIAWNRAPHDYSLAFLESASAAASRPLPNEARAPT
jgi:hypothetical protein